MKYDFCFFYHPHPYDISPDAQLGLGLLSLATYTKNLGASVCVINAQSENIAKALQRIPKCKYLMLYGCLVDLEILSIVATCVKFNQRVDYVYVGGPIAKSNKEMKYVDAIVDGFGEDFVGDLCYGFNPMNNKIKVGIIKNINEYPFPDRSLLNGNYGGSIFKRQEASCEISTTILTSRGCKCKCAFCSSGLDSFYGEYKIDRIEKELESCLSLGIRDIRISDDNLISNRKRLSQICSLFEEAGIRWRASIRTFPNNIEMYEEMVLSGCEELSFGVESGDQDVLNILNKGAKIEQNTEAIKNANKAGIGTTRALLMMGTPGETNNTLFLNVHWIERAKPDIVSLKIFVPYPGTDIYDNPEKYNCTLLPTIDMNNSAYRPDNSQAFANIAIEGMRSAVLTTQFHRLKGYLEERGIENRG